ncbi:hypothetical protein M8J77_000691 [Diaphorina citri]|nr:hypothetical protein M8J77_000691 [Diaphorina citri]
MLYSRISKNLMKPAPGLIQTSSASLRYRKQVILMLGTVVISFFLLLLPFRIITLIILIVPTELFWEWYTRNFHLYLGIVYTSRILIYVNSAINPILYNLMSSKFRNGFYKLFLINNRLFFLVCSGNVSRKNTLTNSLVTTTTTNVTSSSMKHQYSISSVASGGKKHSVCVRKPKRPSRDERSRCAERSRCDERSRCAERSHRCDERSRCAERSHCCSQHEEYAREVRSAAAGRVSTAGSVRNEDTPVESFSSGEDEDVNRLRERGIGHAGAGVARGERIVNRAHVLSDEIVHTGHTFDHLRESGMVHLRESGMDHTGPGVGERIVNRTHILSDENCPVCKLFNRFEPVNRATTCKYNASCTDTEEHEFCRLFRTASVKCINEETVPNEENGGEMSDEFRNLKESKDGKLESDRRKAFRDIKECTERRKEFRDIKERTDRRNELRDIKENKGGPVLETLESDFTNKVTGQVDRAVHINVPNDVNIVHKQITGDLELEIEEVHGKGQGNSDDKHELVKVDKRKAVPHRDDRKVLRRSSTYDLFADKIYGVKNKPIKNNCPEDPDGPKNLENLLHKSDSRGKFERKKLHKLKATSLENEYHHSWTCNDATNEKVLWYLHRSRSNDQEYCPVDQYGFNNEDVSDHDEFPNNCCKCDEKQVPVGINDFNNYVNFESINKGLVDKLLKQQQYKVRHSISLNDSFKNGEYRNRQKCDICKSVRPNDLKAFQRTHQCFEHTHSCCQAGNQTRSIVFEKCLPSSHINEEFYKLPPKRATNSCKSFDQLSPTTKLDRSERNTKDYSKQRKNSQTYQTLDEIKTLKSPKEKLNVQHENYEKADARIVQIINNRFEIVHPDQNQSDETFNQDTNDLSNFTQKTNAQTCYCSTRNKRGLLRRKSFDLTMYTSRENQLHRKYFGKLKRGHMARRKSCDFGQIRDESRLPSTTQRTQDVGTTVGNGRTKRCWSNESIVEKDLCSIFENPMTAYNFQTQNLIEAQKKNRFEALFEHKYEADLLGLEYTNKNSSEIRIEVSRSAGFGRKHLARRSSFSSTTHTEEQWNLNQQSYLAETNYPDVKKSGQVKRGGTNTPKEIPKLLHSRSFHMGTGEVGILGRHRRLSEEVGYKDYKGSFQQMDKEDKSCFEKYVLKKRKSLNL